MQVNLIRGPGENMSKFLKRKEKMMNDKDIEEYHNIGKSIKHSEKYSYVNGTQSMDHGSRIYDVAGYRLPSVTTCLLYTSPSPRDRTRSRMPSSA